MTNTLYKTRLTPAAYGDAKIALFLGTPLVALGDVVNVRDLALMTTERDLFVKEILVTEIVDTPQEFLTPFGYANFNDMRVSLSELNTTALPADAQVTILVLTDMDSGIQSLYTEEEDEEEDIPEYESEDSDLDD